MENPKGENLVQCSGVPATSMRTTLDPIAPREKITTQKHTKTVRCALIPLLRTLRSNTLNQ